MVPDACVGEDRCGRNSVSRSHHALFTLQPPTPLLVRAVRGAHPPGLPTEAQPLRTDTTQRLVGLSRFELLTPRLSSVCSNQLSYRPFSLCWLRQLKRGQRGSPSRSPPSLRAPSHETPARRRPVLSKLDRRASSTLSTRSISSRLMTRSSWLAPRSPATRLALERR
jgi:hypothetical protein